MSRWQFPRQVRRVLAPGLTAVLVWGIAMPPGSHPALPPVPRSLPLNFPPLPFLASPARAAERNGAAEREERERRWYEERREKRQQREIERRREETGRRERDRLEIERERDWQQRRKALEYPTAPNTAPPEAR